MYSPAVTDSLTAYFSAGSPLAAHLPGFRPRAGQSIMAEAVAETIRDRDHLLVEAGTGTGKTFAYLLPALLSGRRTIISTGTRALQDQLYHRDLPLLGRAVGRPVSTALLKGRSNYLCLHRLEQAPADARDAAAADFEAVERWRHRTGSGDRAELATVPEDSPVWPQVTSTVDNCLGQQCPRYSDCFVVKARRAAQEADLVVVNHHLLLADLAMKESGFVEFLPGADAVIVDEAHQLPDLAVQFFGLSLGTKELERLADEAEAATLPFRERQLVRRIDGLRRAARQLALAAPREAGRYELDAVAAELGGPLAGLAAALADLVEALAVIADATADIDNVLGRVEDAALVLAQLVDEYGREGLRWVDVRPRSVRLHLTPLDVSGTMRGLTRAAGQAWILTSATLAIGEDFSHFAGRLGLGDARALKFPSPYALERRGLVYLPPGLPAPSSPVYTDAVMSAVLPVLELTSGGVFALFTSHRALAAAQSFLKRRRKKLGGRPLLVQGSAPREELLRRFRESGNALLLGTGTFWEGVDVRGPALTVVAIDKLPFASPADPLTMARIEYLKREGANAFVEHQLPQAALGLKQGAGRLLRDDDDYGVIVLCDPRIRGKAYGRVFLECLAPMPSTDDPEVVRRFFDEHEARAAGLRA